MQISALGEGGGAWDEIGSKERKSKRGRKTDESLDKIINKNLQNILERSRKSDMWGPGCKVLLVANKKVF